MSNYLALQVSSCVLVILIIIELNFIKYAFIINNINKSKDVEVKLKKSQNIYSTFNLNKIKPPIMCYYFKHIRHTYILKERKK